LGFAAFVGLAGLFPKNEAHCAFPMPAIVLRANAKPRAMMSKMRQNPGGRSMLAMAVAAAAAVSIMAVDPTLISDQKVSPDSRSGMASVYSLESSRLTASGARLDPAAFTAAHRTLPFGTRARVTNQHNGRSVVVTINDRGPFVHGRIIDLTPAAARAIGFSGVTPVTLTLE
jgi:rare lipoprotein A